MANELTEVIQVTQAQMDTLLSGGTVGGQSYDASKIYLVDEDDWHFVRVSSNPTTISGLVSNATYQFEAVGTGTYAGVISFPLITMNSSATSTSTPITALGVDLYSSTTSNRLVRLEFYYSSGWKVSTKYTTSVSSWTAMTGYILRYRRVNI